MKKLISTVLVCVMLSMITACGTGKKTATQGSPDGLYASVHEDVDSPEWVKRLASGQDGEVSQLFIVAALGESKTTAYISMHEKDENGNWKEIMSTPGYVGKYGLCADEDHVEGCGQTPMGTYTFNKAFGIADDPGCALPYTKVDDDTYWSGDSREGMHYNELVNIKDYPDLDMTDSEHIKDYDYEYQYCLNISFNDDGTQGRGSAIFLHCLGTRKPYTGGCVAIPENQMLKVMKNVKEDCVVEIGLLKDLSPELWDELGLAGTVEDIPAMENDGDDRSAAGIANDDSEFKYWSDDSKAAASIREYVKTVTDLGSKDFIPEEDRIAVFDMDGTLTCETFYTYYDTMMFIEFCLKDHPEMVSEELKEAARAIEPGYTAGEELARNFAKAYAGMTVDELYDYAVEFGQKETASFNNMRYADGFYLPMAEVVKYLYDNGFTIYVVSGTERTTTRAIVDNSPISEYVASEHVIGTEFEVKVKGNEDVSSNMDYKYADGDELVFTGGFIQKNLNANKAIWIEREIGKRPVLAFGNSGSDTSMMNYTIDKRNPYLSAAYMVVADDDVREWGTQDWDEKSSAYEEQGYVPISMKNDFTKIYPDPIVKSDTQYVVPDNIIEFETDTENAEVKDAA